MSVVAGIIDIVGSRSLTDRAAVQREIERAFADAERRVAPLHPLWATAGDEFQIIYRSPQDAMISTGCVRLQLDGADVRFGLGQGTVRDVASGANGPIQDGSAWILAREAIEEGEEREERLRSVRTWFRSEEGVEVEAVVNAALLARDQIISRMKPRERRITAAAVAGATQAEIGKREGISQSAVSQSLTRSGGAVLAAIYGAE